MAAVTGRRWMSVDGKRALWIATITCDHVRVRGREKEFSPGENIFLFHMITVFFVAILSGVFTFIVLQRIGRLHRKIASTEERYRTLFERSLAGAYRTALDGRIIDCNVAFCRMFGYASREDMIGKSIQIGYIDPTDRIRFVEKLKADKSVINFEQRFRRKDGSTIWVLNSATLLTPDRGTGAVINGTLTDITDLRTTRQLLQDSESKYRVLFEDSVDAYWLMDGKNINTLALSFCST